MSSYKVSKDGDVVKVGFGDAAQNDQMGKDGGGPLDEMVAAGELPGGEMIRVNGPASLPVAMVLAHRLAHIYGAVACFDPKLGKYVVSIAHGGKHAIGDLID